MDMNQKHACITCNGLFTYRNKSAHLKTKKHMDALAPYVLPLNLVEIPIVPIEPEIKQMSELDDAFKALCSNLTDAQKLQIINFMAISAVNTDEYERYLDTRSKTNKTREELELYLLHHRVDGLPLSDSDKDFLRGI